VCEIAVGGFIAKQGRKYISICDRSFFFCKNGVFGYFKFDNET